jgi:hypothetical protein
LSFLTSRSFGNGPHSSFDNESQYSSLSINLECELVPPNCGVHDTSQL